MTLLADITRVARRPTTAAVWQCFWCWEHIKKGDKYREQRYVEDGEINTVRGHPECYAAHNRADMDPEEPITQARPRGMTLEESEAIRVIVADGVREGFMPLREVGEAMTRAARLAIQTSEKLEQKRFWDGVERAKAEVAAWPEWKRNAFTVK